jgi:hypothetical protein
MSEKNSPSFIPFVNFNDAVFIELDRKIRPFLNEKPRNLNRELQIRTLLYVNFNNYLTLLLTKADENVAFEALDNIEKIPEDKRLELIIAVINEPIEVIINNFVDLFDKIN